MAMLTMLKRMKRTDLTVHGFRSTFRDWAAERTDYPAEMAEIAWLIRLVVQWTMPIVEVIFLRVAES
jgi:hypothetical protein